MSGFAGAVPRDGAGIDESAFAAMGEVIRAQGRDSCRSVMMRNIALSSSHLLIPNEPHRGEQPLSLDGESWIVADARLDDRESLTGSLRVEGEPVSPDSADAELILRAYRVWGQECLSRLWGDFAFAIRDERRRTLFCARDHFGCKPFYFAHKNGEFLFSNTLRSIQRHPLVSERLDERAIGDFLLFDLNRHPELTYFADIRRLPPAHYLCWSDGRLRTGRYWRFPIDEELHYDRPRDYIEHFLHLLRAAVKDRIRTDRVGILMSGGMDSTAVAATAAEAPVSIRAFSTVYDRILPDRERSYASSAAQYLGIPISFLRADDYGFLERSGCPADQPPEPQNTPYYAVWMDQFRMAARFSPVALHGNGGDEILDQPGSQILSLLRCGQMREAAAEYLRFVATHGWLPRVGMLGAVRRKLGRSSSWAP
ncbi:MAG: asparagine synthetase B, partial [bacterium]|nr:asparagine synthetase B [bacterium]